MNNKEKFLNFLEAIKTEDNTKLIENVIEGFSACHEGGMLLSMVPQNVIGGKDAPISSNIPSSDASEEEQEEQGECPECPDAGEADPEVRKKLADDIMQLLADPAFRDIIKEKLVEMGEV